MKTNKSPHKASRIIVRQEWPAAGTRLLWNSANGPYQRKEHGELKRGGRSK